MAIIEGVGDEVLLCVVILGLLAVILFAWASTRVRPMFNNGSVWMVHMQTAPERRVLEVYSLDDSSAPAHHQLAAATSGIEELSVESSPTNGDQSTPNLNTSTSEESDENSETQPKQPQLNIDHSNNSVGINNSSVMESARRRNIPTPEGAESSSGHHADGPEINPTSTADTTTIKLKFLDDTQRLVAAWLSQTVGEFKRQHFETDVSQGKIVRLIYRGQLLRDDSRSLASYGLHENCVLHCHVSTTPYTQQSMAGNRGARAGLGPNATGRLFVDNSVVANGLDLGRYIYVIFAFKFAALWSAWFVFPEYFSRTSLVSLILCSGLFMLFWYGSQRRRPVSERTENPIGSNQMST